jgi:hypothetical protein
MIYDEKRSFTAFVGPEQGQAYSGLIRAVILTGAPKAYLWAVRESDRDLRILIDDVPDQNITW